MRILCISVAIFLTSSSAAWANTKATCKSGEEVIFACLTKAKKQVLVCDAGKTIRYSFGAIGKSPEIVISAPRTAVRTYQWNGFGRYENYELSIPSNAPSKMSNDAQKATVYSVHYARDRLSLPDGEKVEAGVRVDHRGKSLPDVRCVDGRYGITQGIEGIENVTSE